MSFDNLTFNLREIIALIGIIQCVYIFVYMSMRAGSLKFAAIPFLYFLFLGVAFTLDFSARYIGDLNAYYSVFQWAAWFVGPPLSVLLIIQISRMNRLPNLADYGVLFILPMAYMVAVVGSISDVDCVFPRSCEVLYDWLITCGLFAGALSLFVVWLKRGEFHHLYNEKAGKDRYWVILTLIYIHLFFLMFALANATGFISNIEFITIRNIIGIGLVYLTATSLFRIYPLPAHLLKASEVVVVNEEELSTARRIENLLNVEKVYHEASYSRTDLARELDLPETVVSRIVSAHFGKSLPRLLNERRVQDAMRLLEETEASVSVVSSESGFNSMASFNRVFRDIAGETPSGYRQRKKASS
jgi:AraC-like DNA-binding protein